MANPNTYAATTWSQTQNFAYPAQAQATVDIEYNGVLVSPDDPSYAIINRLMNQMAMTQSAGRSGADDPDGLFKLAEEYVTLRLNFRLTEMTMLSVAAKLAEIRNLMNAQSDRLMAVRSLMRDFLNAEEASLEADRHGIYSRD